VLRERVVHLSHIEGTTISDIVTKNGIARTNLHRRLPPRLPQVITVGGPAPPPRDKRAVGRGSNHVVRKPGTTTPVLSHFLGSLRVWLVVSDCGPSLIACWWTTGSLPVSVRWSSL